MISIILPSWDDYKYLKPCLESIRAHTVTPYEILIHLNTFDDKMCELVSQYDSHHSRSETNRGIAYATNQCAMRAQGDWFFFPNSDMIFLPDWDIALLEAIQVYGSLNIFSSTMIEPRGNNENFIIKDYGTEPENFRMADLLNDLPGLKKHGYYKKHIVPYLIPSDIFTEMDERMWPGWVTDDDIAVSIFTQNSDIKFIRVADSLVYHFMCKSTHRIGTEMERYQLGEQAKAIFNAKWGKVYPGMNSENYRYFIYSDFEGMKQL